MEKENSEILEKCLQKLATFTAGTSKEIKLLFEKKLSNEVLANNFFPNDQEKVNFSKSFMRQVRAYVQGAMEKSVASNGSLYTPEIEELLYFVFWCAEIDLIDAGGAFVIMEDVYDCLSLREIVSFFEFMEKQFTKKERAFPMSQQQSLLRIGNSILKKFSKVHDTELRGRVQMFLTFISPLSDKTGLNQKSLINPNNPTYYDKTSPENESSSLLGSMRVPFSFYQKFWALQKYLHNPILLFSADDEVDPLFLQKSKQENVSMEEEVEDSSKKAGTKANTGATAKFNAFCEVIFQTLEILEKDVYEVGNVVHAVKRYPKYFTESALLEKQLKDPHFRKTWLTQVELCIFALKNPIKFVKSQYELSLEDNKILDEIETRIDKVTQKMYLASNTREKNQKENLAKSRSLHKQLQPFLQKEKHFIVWKENNCQSYEKPPPKDLIDVFGLHEGNMPMNKLEKTMTWKTRMTPCGPSSRYMNKTFRYVQENASKYLGYTQFDASMDFKMLDTEKMQLSEDPVDPSVAYFFDNIIYDIRNPPDEEDKIVNDQTYVFRALRVLSRNHIHLFAAGNKSELSNEWKAEEIARRMLKVTESGGAGTQASEKQDTDQAPPKEEQTSEVTEVSGDKEKAKILRPVRTDSKAESASSKVNEKEKTEAGETQPNGTGSKDTSKDIKGGQSNRSNRDDRPAEKTQERGKSREKSQNRNERNQEKGSDRNQEKRNDRNTDQDKTQDRSRRKSPEGDNQRQDKGQGRKPKD